ncbi:MAG: hypothetical protein IPH35_18265 [Rhodoferax sp.]|nr:hypothetical protein [Rhodoferax sp.]
MSHTKRAVVEHIGYFGQVVTEGSLRAGPIPYHFTLNSPVGIQMDAYSNLWVCDTGNNRIIVFDAELNTIVHVLSGIGTKADSDRFLLPFHLCRHPIRNWMYCTDLGNGRVVVFEYDRTRVQYVMSFGGNTDSRNLKNEDFTPLSDPNGITVVKESDGSVSVFVCDEFNYCKTDFVQRNRCLKFTEDGRYLYDFRGIRDQQSRTQHDLIWPQGIGSDSKGNIYLANTGVMRF